MRKISILLIVLILPLILAGCGKQEEETEATIKKQVEIQRIVKQDEINADLVLNGTIVPKEYSVIRSLTPGTIEYLAPVGSQVYMGQPLFSIRDSGIESGYFNALQSYEQTKVITSQRVQQAELALNSSQARLDFAEINFTNAKFNAEQNAQTLEDAALVSYNSSYNTSNRILIFLSDGDISNYEYDYKNVLTAYTQIKIDANNQFLEAAEKFLELESTTNKDELLDDLNQIHDFLLALKTTADSTATLLQSSIPGGEFPGSSISFAYSNALSAQIDINFHITDIIAAINNVKNIDTNLQLAVDQAQSQLDLANIEFSNATIAAQSAKDGAELEQNIAQSQFNGAAYSYNNLTLSSPFSGTILSHFVTAGEQASIGQQLIEVGNLDIIEISVDVDVDFAKAISLSDEVMIDEQYAGFVAEIEPIGDLTSGKVSIKVQSQERQQDLVAGSVAEVKFNLKYKDINSIVIPIKAATIEASGNYVFVIDDNNIVSRKSVTLGKIFSDKVSVISGLEENDRLVLLNGVFVSEGDEIEIISEQ